MRPPVRRIRRWSFVATLPGALLVAHVYRVLVPRSTIAATADRERVPGERGLVERDGAVLLARAAASTRPPPTKASRRTLSAAAE